MVAPPLGVRPTRCPTLSAYPCLAVAGDDVFIGHSGSEQTAIAFSGFQRVGVEGDMVSDNVRDNQPLVLSDIWSVKGEPPEDSWSFAASKCQNVLRSTFKGGSHDVSYLVSRLHVPRRHRHCQECFPSLHLCRLERSPTSKSSVLICLSALLTAASG